MSIKAKTVYTTTDGNQHESRDAANKHEAAWKVKSGLENCFVSNAPSRIPREFAINVLNDPAKLKELRDICNKGLDYHRNYGRLKKNK